MKQIDSNIGKAIGRMNAGKSLPMSFTSETMVRIAASAERKQRIESLWMWLVGIVVVALGIATMVYLCGEMIVSMTASVAASFSELEKVPPVIIGMMAAVVAMLLLGDYVLRRRLIQADSGSKAR